MASPRPWPSIVMSFMLGNLNAYIFLSLIPNEWGSLRASTPDEGSVEAARFLRIPSSEPQGLEQPKMPGLKNVSTEMEALQVDIYGLPSKFLNSSSDVKALMEKWIFGLGLYSLGEASHQFEGEGLTMMWLLSTSHATIHTWPSQGYVAIDLLSCGAKDLVNASSKLQAMVEPLAPNNITFRFAWKLRGQYDVPIMDDQALMPTELHTEKVPVVRTTSKYQKIEVWDVYGKSWIDQEHILASRRLYLGGHLQVDTDDEFMYHEMLIHPIMLAHENPRQICILGGGDLLALESVLRHTSVESATVVEIDEMVINAAKGTFGSKDDAADPRATIIIQDAFAWMANYSSYQSGSLDVLFFDLIDITLPSPLLDLLFTGDKLESFIRHVGLALRADGAAVFQIGEYEYDQYCGTVGGLDADCMGNRRQVMFVNWVKKTFSHVRLYKQYVPSFRGEWTFVVATQNAALVGERWNRPGPELDAAIAARIRQSDTLGFINGSILAAQRFVPLTEAAWLEPFQPRAPEQRRQPWKAEACEHIIPSRPNSPYKGYQMPYRVAMSSWGAGDGVFTLSRIRRGETIWKFHNESFIEITPENWLAAVQAQEYAKEHGVDAFLSKDWINEWDTPQGTKMYLELDDARFTNHGYTPLKEANFKHLGDYPNATEDWQEYQWGKVLIALRDIEPCEEILEDYMSSHSFLEEDKYQAPSWWDEILKSRGFSMEHDWPPSRSKFAPPFAWTSARANSD